MYVVDFVEKLKEAPSPLKAPRTTRMTVESRFKTDYVATMQRTKQQEITNIYNLLLPRQIGADCGDLSPGGGAEGGLAEFGV